MQIFRQMLWMNLNRRRKEGFALGYNIIVPVIFILVLGAITTRMFSEEISSYQYYGVVMVPFCLCLGIITMLYAAKDDAYQETAYRIMAAPVSPWIIVMVKVGSGTIVLAACSVSVSIGAAALSHIPFDCYLIWVIALMLVLSLFISALGTFIGLGMKNFMVLKNIVSIPVCIFGIAGGVFFRFGTSNAIVQLLLDCSPFTWINRACFLALFDHNTDLIKGLIVGGEVLGGLCIVLAAKCFKREEYVYGNLPSYEK